MAVQEGKTVPINDSQNEQLAICEKFGSRFVATPQDARIGVALKTMDKRPINGLRHPPHGNMGGWYIWGGDSSVDNDFFQVLHAGHFPTKYPDLVKFLALEPGFRFLFDGNYIDVWFDKELLNI